MPDFIRTFIKNHQQFVTYSLIGISGVILDFVAFVVLFNALGVNPLLANFLSTSLGITNNFILNRHYNFKRTDYTLLRFASFYATGIVGIILSTLLLRVFHDNLGLDANLVKAVSIIIVVITQYSLNKHISFRDIQAKHGSSWNIIRTWLRGHWLEVTSIMIALLGFAALFTSNIGPDEVDNVLGAKLILQGQFPYIDFFSHHMPGMYFLAVPFYVISSNDLFVFRVLFNTALFGWLLYNFWLLRRYGNTYAAATYVVLFGLAQSLLLQNVFLAETIIAYAVSTVVILLLLAPVATLRKTWTMVGVSLLLFCVATFAIAYIYIAALLYLWFLVRIFQKDRALLARWLGIVATPFVIFGICVLASGSLHDFVFDNLTFNSQYYSKFFGAMGSNPIDVAIHIVKTTGGQFRDVIIGGLGRDNIVQALMLTGAVALPIILWLTKQRVAALFTAGLLLFINARVGLYGPGAIENSFAQSLSQHAAPYRSLAFVFLVLCMVYLLQPKVLQKVRSLNIVPLLVVFVCGYLLVVGTSLLSLDAKRFKDLSISNMYEYQQYMPGPAVTAANAVADKNDTVWAGPFDFYSQLHLEAKRVTRYTFYLPWHAECPSCREEFTTDLAKAKPTVILWDQYGTDPNAGDRPNVYGKEVVKLLKEDYYQLPDEQLPTVFFRNDQYNVVNQKMKELGYDTE
jgi:putative flippase GtrA